eukprot:PITA_02579
MTEKEFLVIIYAINRFRHYITEYTTSVHTDHADIRYLMNKPITPGRITRWILLLQEFDINIVDKPGKDNVVADFLSRIENNRKNTPIEDNSPDEHLFVVFTNTLWYADIANYLATGKVPRHLSYKDQRKIIHHSTQYSWMEGYLFHIWVDQQIRCCVAEDDICEILKATHDGPSGGNFADKRIGHKVLHMGYYWPSIFRDARDYVVLEPFKKWAIDFFGPFSPPHQKAHILVCTNYVTKWVEARAVTREIEQVVADFRFEEIFARYGTPKEIMSDGGAQFTSHMIGKLMQKYRVKHRVTTPYHPRQTDR